jgi:hypothetical protein
MARTPIVVATVALALAAAAAASTRSPLQSQARTVAPTATRVQRQVLAPPVVPLRVQRLLKRRAPRAAYVPTRLPAGYTYLAHENHFPRGFLLGFTCCDDNLSLISFNAGLVKSTEPCNQGLARKVFRIDGVVVGWTPRRNDQKAWRCIRQGSTRLLLTVSGEAPHNATSWRAPRQLAQMAASARPIR